MQRVTARGVDAPKILRVNERWATGGSRVRVGHFAAADRALSLGQSRGNQFVVILRELRLEALTVRQDAQDEAVDGTPAVSEGRVDSTQMTSECPHGAALRNACDAALSRMSTHGFVNYFGLQRFGSTTAAVPTHAVGALLLQGALRRSLQAILDPHAPGLSAAERAARSHFGATADAAAAMRLLPRPSRRGGQTLTQRLLSQYAAALTVGGVPDTDATAADSTSLAAASDGAQEASAAEDAAAASTLGRLPRRELLLYVNSLQSLAFNRAASLRMQMANAPIAGDLVWTGGGDVSPDGPNGALPEGGDDGAPSAHHDEVGSIVPDPVLLEAGASDGSAVMEASDDRGASILASAPERAMQPRAALPPAVHVLTAAEAASGQYALADVLLPLPGHAVTYPGHAAGAEYARAMAELGLQLGAQQQHAAGAAGAAGHVDSSGVQAQASLRALSVASQASEGDHAHEGTAAHGRECPAARWFQTHLFDLPGGYRPLLAFASKLSGTVLSYADPTATLEPSDLDALEPRAPAMAAPPRAPRALQLADKVDTADACHLGRGLSRTRYAWRVSFELPASVYATMFLRELLHQPLDTEEHARRSKAVLAGSI